MANRIEVPITSTYFAVHRTSFLVHNTNSRKSSIDEPSANLR